uniref:Uncharacterized protein LOC111111245 isoform X2 n=1 Tax=Crassostrea virginica TaxID=6565 RepID=A0A8B8BKE5_CRAVI|nr:uncharacterized protein LOC111111245 isoform X2 [Crassostrea virginica]
MEDRKRKYSPPQDSNTEISTTTVESLPPTSSSDPSSENDSFPQCTSQWKRCDIDKLGIKMLYRGCAMDVVYEWGLYTMFRKDVVSEELNTVEKILDICDSIAADFLSFEELQSKFDENPEICNTFLPTEKISFGMGLHRPDVATKKVKIKGEIVSSTPDILCYGLEGKVLCLVEVFGEDKIKKMTQGDGPVVKKTRHATSEVDPCLPESLLAQHIGELLAYVDSSVTHMDLCGSVGRDILGFTVEKTLVSVTHLQLTELSWEKIQNSTKKGSIKHSDKPVLHYSRRYNYLKKSDRQELFKVILHLKLMQSVHEKITLQRKSKGTTDILSKKRIEQNLQS